MLYVIYYEHRISPYRWSHIGTMMADVKMATCRCLGSQFSETGSNILLLTTWPCWPLAFLRATHTCLPRFLDVDHFQRLLYIILYIIYYIYIDIYCIYIYIDIYCIYIYIDIYCIYIYRYILYIYIDIYCIYIYILHYIYIH